MPKFIRALIGLTFVSNLQSRLTIFRKLRCRKFGFTLAEVLITLGIIGVVAAMTLPALIQNNRKKEVETKLAKVYSVVNQAINLVKAENGDYKNWVKYCGSSATPTCTTDDLLIWYNEYLGKQIKSLKVEKVTTPTAGIMIYFADGGILFVENCIYDMRFYTDKKAIENPNGGRTMFQFRFNPFRLVHQSEFSDYNTTLNKGFEPYSYKWDGTREGLINGNNAGAAYGCAKGAGKSFCAKLIQYDGWKIKDDYPW